MLRGLGGGGDHPHGSELAPSAEGHLCLHHRRATDFVEGGFRFRDRGGQMRLGERNAVTPEQAFALVFQESHWASISC